MKFVFAIVFFTCIFLQKNSYAQMPNLKFYAPNTVEQLLFYCDSQILTNIAYCRGIIDTLSTTVSVLLEERQDTKKICYAEDVSYDQIRLVFIKWAKAHPENLHKAASFSVYDALAEYFPCAKQ
jgi:hypothetical protein